MTVLLCFLAWMWAIFGENDSFGLTFLCFLAFMSALGGP